MLLLSRRPGELIKIGDDIVVQVMSVKGHQVRIGVAAPKELRVMRSELTAHDTDAITAPAVAGTPPRRGRER